MLSYSETENALAIHSRREATRAIAAMHTAKKLREDALVETKKWAGPGVAAHQQAIKERAEVEAQKHEQMSQRHLERSATAAAGYLLHRTDLDGVEGRDPRYCMEHQALIAASHAHGLVRSEPVA
jgi:hypothetical protein